MLVLGIFMVFGNQINSVAYDKQVHVLLRVLMMGGLFQYGLAGLGITVVSILRRESFLSHGLRTKNILPAIGLSALCCLPDLIYQIVAGNAHTWFPFSDVNFTDEVVASGFPVNAVGMAIIAICWGFFEGFNYVVIADKISERYPSKYRFWDWGAFICAVMCILIHGAVGVTPDAIIEMLCTVFLIYGMLLVRKETGNAWGCVLIFFAYWNTV